MRLNQNYQDMVENIINLGNYPFAVGPVVDFLKTVNSSTPNGKYLLDCGIIANVQRYETKPSNMGYLESHLRYIDIQCVIEGEEIIEFCPVEGLLVKDEYNFEKDVSFYFDGNNLKKLHLTPGTFTIFYPKDAHKPGLYLNGRSFVLKVVFKIPV